MKQQKRILLLLLVLASTLKGYSEVHNSDSLSVKYKIDEEWYFQAQGGISYIAAENTRFMNFWKVLSPQMTLSLGKYFTPVWGARLQLIGGRDKGVYYAHDKNSPTYSFGHYGMLGIGSFNITNFVNRNKSNYNNRRWNVNALFGLGTIHTSFGHTENIPGANAIDLNNHVYLSLFAGVELARKLSPDWDINLELSSNWMDNKFNGQKSVKSSKLNFDGIINLLIGVRYTFNHAKRANKARKTTPLIEPFVLQPRLPEKEMKHNVVTDKPKLDTTKKMVTYYSIEELLEIVDNNEPIRGKQLAQTEVVSFDYGTCAIKTFNSIYLDKVAELMKKTNIVLIVRGFAEKESVFDDKLTEQRIKAVRNYLLKCGIKRDRLVYQCVKNSAVLPDDKGKGLIVELEILSL